MAIEHQGHRLQDALPVGSGLNHDHGPMVQKKLVIYGNGQMARMFYHFARLEYEVVAFTVDRAVINSPEFEGLPVIPFDEIARQCPPAIHKMITAVGYLEMNRLRARKYVEARALGYSFANYLHPSVMRHESMALGENNIVLDHVSLHPYTRLGNGNFVCSNTVIGHGSHVHDYCWINSGVSIAGETAVKSYCFVGVNAAIGDNITIEESCYIGANTLITRSTKPAEVYISASGERFPLASEDFLRFLANRNPSCESIVHHREGPSGET